MPDNQLDILIRTIADTTGVKLTTAEIEKLKTGLGGLSQTAGVVKNNLDAVMGSLGVGVGIGAIIGLAKAEAETVRSTQDLAEVMGITVTEASRLAFGVESTGASMYTLRAAAFRAAGALEEARTGTGAMAETFARMNIDPQGVRGIPDLLGQIGNFIRDSTLPQEEKLAAMHGVLGRSSNQLLSYLREGAAGMEALGQKAAAAGREIDEQAVAAVKTFNAELARLQNQLKSQVGLPVIKFGADHIALTEAALAVVALTAVWKTFVAVGGATVLTQIGAAIIAQTAAVKAAITTEQQWQTAIQARTAAQAAAAATAATVASAAPVAVAADTTGLTRMTAAQVAAEASAAKLAATTIVVAEAQAAALATSTALAAANAGEAAAMHTLTAAKTEVAAATAVLAGVSGNAAATDLQQTVALERLIAAEAAAATASAELAVATKAQAVAAGEATAAQTALTAATAAQTGATRAAAGANAALAAEMGVINVTAAQSAAILAANTAAASTFTLSLGGVAAKLAALGPLAVGAVALFDLLFALPKIVAFTQAVVDLESEQGRLNDTLREELALREKLHAAALAKPGGAAELADLEAQKRALLDSRSQYENQFSVFGFNDDVEALKKIDAEVAAITAKIATLREAGPAVAPAVAPATPAGPRFEVFDAQTRLAALEAYQAVAKARLAEHDADRAAQVAAQQQTEVESLRAHAGELQEINDRAAVIAAQRLALAITARKQAATAAEAAFGTDKEAATRQTLDTAVAGERQAEAGVAVVAAETTRSKTESAAAIAQAARAALKRQADADRADEIAGLEAVARNEKRTIAERAAAYVELARLRKEGVREGQAALIDLETRTAIAGLTKPDTRQPAEPQADAFQRVGIFMHAQSGPAASENYQQRTATAVEKLVAFAERGQHDVPERDHSGGFHR